MIKFSFNFNDSTFQKFYKIALLGVSEDLGFKKAFIQIDKSNILLFLEENYMNAKFTMTCDNSKNESEIPLMYSLDLEKFLKAIEKFRTPANKKEDSTISFFFNDKSIRIENSVKSNKIIIPIQLIDQDKALTTINKVGVFYKKYFEGFDSKKVILSDSLATKMDFANSLYLTTQTKNNGLKLINGNLQYFDKFSIVSTPLEDNLDLMETKIHIGMSKVLLKFKEAELIDSFKITTTDRFIYFNEDIPNNYSVEAILAQKPICFEGPTQEQIDCIAPTSKSKEYWSFDFTPSSMLNRLIDFKSIFSENSWVWEPIRIHISRETPSSVKLLYKDYTAEEEVDLPVANVVNFNGFDNIKEYEFIMPSQIVRNFLTAYKEELLTLYVAPISEIEQNATENIGFTLEVKGKPIRSIFAKLEEKY
jgi:hypothetical protein